MGEVVGISSFATGVASVGEYVVVGCTVSQAADAAVGAVGAEVADEVVADAMCLVMLPVVSPSVLMCCTKLCSLLGLTTEVSLNISRWCPLIIVCWPK